MLLYDGSPLLIVYGTAGDTTICEAMRSGAEAASKRPQSGLGVPMAARPPATVWPPARMSSGA